LYLLDEPLSPFRRARHRKRKSPSSRKGKAAHGVTCVGGPFGPIFRVQADAADTAPKIPHRGVKRLHFVASPENFSDNRRFAPLLSQADPH
jgi:hypothetical protein